MLELHGPGKVHTCDGLTRRDFLQAGSLGAVNVPSATQPEDVWRSRKTPPVSSVA